MVLIPGAWSGPQYGGTLKLGIEFRINGFDPIQTRIFSVSAQTAGHLIMDRLFDLDEKGDIIPMLGLSMTPSEDGKTWTIDLRRGVKFHDGTPFNADAVVHHWQRILNPKNRYSGRVGLRPLTSVKKVNEFTVRFHLKHPWKPFNLCSYANETVDKLLIKQNLSMDQEVRQSALCEVARHVNDDVPMIFLCGRKYYLFAARKIRGLPDPNQEAIRLTDVWILK